MISKLNRLLQSKIRSTLVEILDVKLMDFVFTLNCFVMEPTIVQMDQMSQLLLNAKVSCKSTILIWILKRIFEDPTDNLIFGMELTWIVLITVCTLLVLGTMLVVGVAICLCRRNPINNVANNVSNESNNANRNLNQLQCEYSCECET